MTIIPVACKDCMKTEAEIEICRIYEYQFRVFGKKCPREIELKVDETK